VAEDDDEPDHRAREEDGVRRDEHRVADERAVDGEAGRGGDLAHEEPARDPLARSLLPLLVHLLREGRDEDEGAEPAEELGHP
jgi:hypothetical protein